MRTVAQGISVVLHPVFIPLFTIWLALRVDPHIGFFVRTESRWILLVMIGVMTVVFPLTSTLLLLRAKMLTSVTMPTQAERIMPFTMTLFYYAMTYYLLRQSPVHPIALSIFIGIILTALFTTIITLGWKISAHMTGIGAFTGAISALSPTHDLHLFEVIAGAILLSGIVGTARLLLTDHTPAHIYTGFLLGWGVTFMCVLLGVHI
jgi:hypothetical protein